MNSGFWKFPRIDRTTFSSQVDSAEICTLPVKHFNFENDLVTTNRLIFMKIVVFWLSLHQMWIVFFLWHTILQLVIRTELREGIFHNTCALFFSRAVYLKILCHRSLGTPIKKAIKNSNFGSVRIRKSSRSC